MNLLRRLRTRYLCWRGLHQWVVTGEDFPITDPAKVHCFDCGTHLTDT